MLAHAVRHDDVELMDSVAEQTVGVSIKDAAVTLPSTGFFA
jgi:hypothetical protein